jgi:hypothetical protein
MADYAPLNRAVNFMVLARFFGLLPGGQMAFHLATNLIPPPNYGYPHSLHYFWLLMQGDFRFH